MTSYDSGGYRSRGDYPDLPVPPPRPPLPEPEREKVHWLLIVAISIIGAGLFMAIIIVLVAPIIAIGKAAIISVIFVALGVLLYLAERVWRKKDVNLERRVKRFDDLLNRLEAVVNSEEYRKAISSHIADAIRDTRGDRS